MEPSILRLGRFTIMGIATPVSRGSESAEVFGEIWKQFESRQGEISPHSIDRCYYGVSFGPDERGMIDYLAGMAVRDVEAPTVGLALREIPGADYAVFPCAMEDIGRTYGRIFGEWLPASAYRLDTGAPSFEKYPPAGDAQAPVLIHIPVLPI